MFTYFSQGLDLFQHRRRLPLCAQVAIPNNPMSLVFRPLLTVPMLALHY